eukprot:10519632-Ditylum_brightwellii.AAC.1
MALVESLESIAKKHCEEHGTSYCTTNFTAGYGENTSKMFTNNQKLRDLKCIHDAYAVHDILAESYITTKEDDDEVVIVDSADTLKLNLHAKINDKTKCLVSQCGVKDIMCAMQNFNLYPSCLDAYKAM